MNFWVQNNNNYWKLVLQCWRDDKLKRKFIADPRKVLARYHIEVPPTAQITVCDGSTKLKWEAPDKMELPLPPKPEDYDEDRIDLPTTNVVFCCCD